MITHDDIMFKIIGLPEPVNFTVQYKLGHLLYSTISSGNLHAALLPINTCVINSVRNFYKENRRLLITTPKQIHEHHPFGSITNWEQVLTTLGVKKTSDKPVNFKWLAYNLDVASAYWCLRVWPYELYAPLIRNICIELLPILKQYNPIDPRYDLTVDGLIAWIAGQITRKELLQISKHTFNAYVSINELTHPKPNAAARALWKAVNLNDTYNIGHSVALYATDAFGDKYVICDDLLHDFVSNYCLTEEDLPNEQNKPKD